MLRLAFDFIITWRETRTRPNAYQWVIVCMEDEKSINLLVRDRHFTCKNKESFDN